jgi:hypothetical protein
LGKFAIVLENREIFKKICEKFGENKKFRDFLAFCGFGIVWIRKSAKKAAK